jgi:hypothetical protein
MGWTTKGSEFEPWWGQQFSLLNVIQTGFGNHPASYPMGTRVLSQEVKRPRRESDHSPPTNAEVKETWVYTPTPPYIFKAKYLIS